MTLRRWIRNSKDRYQTLPVAQATDATAQSFKEGLYRRLGWHTRTNVYEGTNIYDLPEWDVLIVFDALRPDIYRAVAREYAWLDANCNTYKTVGGYSLDWLMETFTPHYKRQMDVTGLVAWNPYTGFSDMDYADAFGAFNPVHEYGWSDRYGSIPPNVVTDAGIDMHGDTEKLILWYQQPHTPYRTLLDAVETLNEDAIGNEDNERLTVWNLIRSGDVSPNEAILACADNLRWALDDIARFVDSVDSDTTIRVTADHAELFGEHGRFGHPKQDYYDKQLVVPLATVDQDCVGEPVTYGRNVEPTEDVTERLKVLGYT